MCLVLKLLLVEVLLFQLNEALSIRNQSEKNKNLDYWDSAWNLQHDNVNESKHQPNFYNDFHNLQTTTTSSPYEDYNIVEFSPDTESYNNTAMILDESLEDNQQNVNGKVNKTNSSANHFYTDLTSKIPHEFPWQPTFNTSEEKVDQEVYGLRLQPTVSINSTGIVIYNRTTLPKCPNGLTYYPDGYFFNWTCYVITEPSTFPPPCPLQNMKELKSNLQLLDGIDQTHWSYVYDNHTNACFITNKTSKANLIPANCSDKYPGVCAYRYQMNSNDQSLSDPPFTDYCKKQYNASCISNYLSSPFTCYCVAVSETGQLPRTAFCNKLVEVTDPYENHILVKLLGNYERCWIGLHKLGNLYQWSSTNTTTNYTFWSPNTDFSKPYGALGTNGWSLDDDGTLNCAICEVEDKDPPRAHLHIAHNKTTNTLDVEIENATGIFETITCYAQNVDQYEILDLNDYEPTNYLVAKQKFPFNNSGYYWCKALQIPELTDVYSNTIFIGATYGHEYTFSVRFRPQYISKSQLIAIPRCPTVESLFHEGIFAPQIVKIIINDKNNEGFVLCHITIKPTQLTRREEFDRLSILGQSNDKITNLASIEVCLPSITTSASHTLNWPETQIGVTTIPEELCLQEDGSPVTRTCTGDFYAGSRWLDVNGTCADISYSTRTYLLHNLLKSNTATPSNVSTEVLNITKYTDNFTSFEIHLVSKILEKLTAVSEHIRVSDIAKTIDNIMHIDSNKLKVSQNTLNSTDMILCSLDEILAKTKIDASGYTSEVTKKLAVQISDLKKTNVIGIKLGKTQNGFDTSKVNPLQRGTSQESLAKEDFDLAVVITEQLHNDIIRCMGENLIITLFDDNVLFNEANNTSNNPDGRIVSVSIPNFNCAFTTPFQIIFSPSTTNNTQLKCASWVYGFNDDKKSTRGEWFIEGNPKSFGKSNYQVCEFSHTTHFTLLVLGGTNEISEGHKKALDIITAVGSGLSLLGLLMVFLTAIIFKSFRSANAVVINFSVAMTAQIILLFVADNVAENKLLCTIIGAALHYIVLSQFCWMLTIAILQYRRYVVVFSAPAPYLVATTCACSWGIPLIPIIIIISISRDSYGENSYGLCYALGNYFIFGVLIPVSLIIFINLIIFLRIMLSIAASRSITVHQKKDDTSSLQLRLAIMLYFLLGLTCGFGLLAAIGGGIAYSYLFCITATLQGFILFLYFIVLNEKTRSLWTNMKTCHCKGKSDDVNTDSAATAMLRRPRNTASSDTNTSSTTSEMLRRYKNRSSSDF